MINLTFTKQEQEEFRADFVKDSRRKAWEAICHADWAGKKVVEINANMERMDAEHSTLNDEIEKSKNGFDPHTEESKQKRKELVTKRDALATTLHKTAEELTKAMAEIQNMSKTAAINLDLGEHAKGFKWEDPTAAPEKTQIEIHAEIDAMLVDHEHRRYRFIKPFGEWNEGDEFSPVDLGDGVKFRDFLEGGFVEPVKE